MIGRIRLDRKKESTLLSWAIRRPQILPAQVVIPLRQGPGSATACVKAGDLVRVGQKIAVPANADSAAIHSSLSGTVKAIDSFPHPIQGESLGIEIESDGKDEKISGLGTERTNWEKLTAPELLDLFQESGLVDMNPEMPPLHLKISRQKKCRFLIMNACEDEPYVTAKHALMMSHPVELLKGMEICRRAAGAEKIILVTEQDKLEPAELLKSKIYFLKWSHMEVKMLPAVYPQDAERLLLRQMSALLSSPIQEEEGLVIDIATAFAVYEAVVLQKPLYERVVTVGGECVIEPRNVWARIGADLGTLIKACRGFLREPRKVLMGGPMRGIAQTNLNVPVLKSTEAVLALPKEVTESEEAQPCIRCGRCLEVCPSEISPAMITQAAEHDLFSLAEEFGVTHCIECGNCSFVCPSQRPMLQLIDRALSHLPPSVIKKSALWPSNKDSLVVSF